MELYDQIFKRKSFHLFRNTEPMDDADVRKIEKIIDAARPLDPDIKTETVIVREKETTCRRGADFCILFYSEIKDGYLRNIGYIGEQIDLMLAAENYGALWFGIGKPKELKRNGLDYVIMIAVSKMPGTSFRADMFKSKRKPLSEIWQGPVNDFSDIVRFAPSACNSQPWFVKNDGALYVYRYRKPGKRGIMPAAKVPFYNRIDIGIFICFIEVCLAHGGTGFERELFPDDGGDAEMTLNAVYKIK
ncbi:MAG: nitroreductase [Clostridia bacterium]|nr:nitroreductase [Clostridia bacterium]